MSIEDKVKQIIADQLGCDISCITAKSHLVKDLEADSLDAVEVIMALEESFGIEVADEDADKLMTVEEIVKYIDEQ